MRTLTQGQICRSKASEAPTNGCLFAIITPTFADDPVQANLTTPSVRDSDLQLQYKSTAKMGGFFGAVSKRDIVLDTFFGVD